MNKLQIFPCVILFQYVPIYTKPQSARINCVPFSISGMASYATKPLYSQLIFHPVFFYDVVLSFRSPMLPVLQMWDPFHKQFSLLFIHILWKISFVIIACPDKKSLQDLTLAWLLWHMQNSLPITWTDVGGEKNNIFMEFQLFELQWNTL